ncbi:MAG: hypothetical protein JW720_11100 [Sedimentisphaerales bacterium]|nr:hypothetical protein [Sedimentisphaerales bacterium]
MFADNSKRPGRSWLVRSVAAAGLTLQSISLCLGQGVVWTVTDNPSSSTDKAYAVTSDDSFIYMAGLDNSPGNGQWRIQKRNKADGAAVWTVTDNPSAGFDAAYAITCDYSCIYIAGMDNAPGNAQWQIQKRNKSDGAAVWTVTDNPSSGYDSIFGITSDDSYIYTTGYDYSRGMTNPQWRIQKRNKSDGAVVWTVTDNPTGGYDYDITYAITSDDTCIYVAGLDNTMGNAQWRIQKRNKSDGAVVWTVTENPSSGFDKPLAIASDDTCIYIAGVDYSPGSGQWRIQKRNKADGAAVWTQTDDPSAGVDTAYAVTCDDTCVYVSGMDNAPGNTQWRIQKRNKSDGSVQWTQTDNPSTASEESVGIASDDNCVYIVGDDGSPGNGQWRIQKREKELSAYIDIGLRIYDGTEIISIACEPEGTLTSPLRIAKDGVIYGVVLVPPSDPTASKVMIETSSGVKAIMKL